MTETWSLQGSAIQDWSDDAGFVEYCRQNSNTVVAFDWVPDAAGAVKFTGNCQVVAVDIGGDVATQNTSDWEFAVVGDPGREVHTPAGRAASTKNP